MLDPNLSQTHPDQQGRVTGLLFFIGKELDYMGSSCPSRMQQYSLLTRQPMIAELHSSSDSWSNSVGLPSCLLNPPSLTHCFKSLNEGGGTQESLWERHRLSRLQECLQLFFCHLLPCLHLLIFYHHHQLPTMKQREALGYEPPDLTASNHEKQNLVISFIYSMTAERC